MRRKRRGSRVEYILAGILSLIVIGIIAVYLSGFIMDSSTLDSGMTIYYSPTCQCCRNYIRYLVNEGLNSRAVEVNDVTEIKRELGIPRDLWSCHTLIINGYFVEGHVPIKAIRKLINEQPDIDGISLPGMPLGSPGMGGVKQGEFTIFALSGEDVQVFMKI